MSGPRSITSSGSLPASANVCRAAVSAGRTASYKKAVVKLTADSKTIEFFEGMV